MCVGEFYQEKQVIYTGNTMAFIGVRQEQRRSDGYKDKNTNSTPTGN